MQDQVAANAGLTEGEQRVLQLRQQMAEVERNQGGSFTPEQRAAALGLLTQQQQQDLARQVDTMRIATAGQDNLSAAYGQGYDAVAKVTAQTAGYTASLKFGLPGSDQQRAAADQLTAAYERQAASANKLAIQQATRQNADQLTYLEAETQSLGLNDNARAAYLAHKQAEILLTSKNISLVSDEGAAYLGSVDKISAASVALNGREAALSELHSFIDNTFSTISDAIVSAFATGQQEAVKFKDVAASVIKAVEAEFLKLALINPLKNWILGDDGNSPTLTSVAGVLGKLLGNSGGTTTAVVGSAGVTGVSAVGQLASATAGAQTSQVGAVGSVVASGAENALGRLTGGSITSLNGLGSYIVGQVASALGNTATATNIALSGAGEGVAGVATASQVGAASVANAVGLSDVTAGVISQAAGKVADALPYIGTAIALVTDIVQGNYRGAALMATGAALGAYVGTVIFPGIGTAVGTAIGATVGGLVDAFLPNHPKHPFENVELNVADGRLATGKSVRQLADVAGLVSSTQTYADSVNKYLDSVGVRIQNADMNLAGIGQGITGMAQTLDPNSAFNRLNFGNDPSDTSQFGVAKGALAGMTFDSPQALAAELAKIAGFADAASTLGITLASVGKDLTAIQIASVSGANPDATSTVTDANGLAVSYRSDLRTALNADLPTQTFADTAALDAEMQRVSDFVTGTLPGLLTPVRATQSTLQDQIQASNENYASAMAQSKALGLDNDGPLSGARDRAIAIMMKPALDAINTSLTSIAGRGSALLYGQAGSGAATMANLARTQDNEQTQLYDQIHQAFGDNAVATDNYNRALQSLITTQNAETEVTRQQVQLAQEQGLASLTASEADFAKRAGIDSLSQQLAAYDAKATVETDTFIQSWRAYYGQYAAVGEDFQNQMVALWLAHNNERLQIEQDYNTQSTTQASAAMKQAQGSVASLLGSIKDYALKLQTGSDSPLSPLSQYDLAKSQFNAVSGAALAGDANSAAQLTTYAEAFLSASQNVNDHGSAYAADFSSVLDAIQGISGAADALTQSFIKQNTQNQTDQVVSTLLSTSADLKAEVAALRREVQNSTAQRAMGNG